MSKKDLKLNILTLSLAILTSAIVITNNNYLYASSNFHIETVNDWKREGKKYGVSKHELELVDYTVNKNINIITDSIKNKNYWAYKAVTDKNDNFAESIKNLKIIITKMTIGTLEEKEKFIRNIANDIVSLLYKYKDDTVNNRNTTKLKNNILGLLNGLLIAETIKSSYHNNRNDTNQFENCEDLNELYENAVDKIYSIILNLESEQQRPENNVCPQILNALISESLKKQKLSKNATGTVSLLKCALQHDWTCYLTQFGVINWYQIKHADTDGSENIDTIHISVLTRISQTKSVMQNYCETVLYDDKSFSGLMIDKCLHSVEEISKMKEFKDDWIKVNDSYQKLKSKTRVWQQFITKNKYDGKYVLFTESWKVLHDYLADNERKQFFNVLDNYLYTVMVHLYNLGYYHSDITSELVDLLNSIAEVTRDFNKYIIAKNRKQKNKHKKINFNNLFENFVNMLDRYLNIDDNLGKSLAMTENIMDFTMFCSATLQKESIVQDEDFQNFYTRFEEQLKNTKTYDEKTFFIALFINHFDKIFGVNNVAVPKDFAKNLYVSYNGFISYVLNNKLTEVRLEDYSTQEVMFVTLTHINKILIEIMMKYIRNKQKINESDFKKFYNEINDFKRNMEVDMEIYEKVIGYFKEITKKKYNEQKLSK